MAMCVHAFHSTPICPHGHHLSDRRLNSRNHLRTAFRSDAGFLTISLSGSKPTPGPRAGTESDIGVGVGSPNQPLKELGALRFAEGSVLRLDPLDAAEVGQEDNPFPLNPSSDA
jgi:hypothetical protein